MNTQLKFGIVSEAKPGFVRVVFKENDNMVSDWLPVLVKRSMGGNAENWQLEPREHVVCMMDAFCEEGVCLGAIHSEEDRPDRGEGKGKFRKVFSDGTVIEYDSNSHEMTVDVKGQLKAKTTGEASIEAMTQLNGKAGVKAAVEAPAIELTGAVQINGALVVSGVVSAGAIATTGGGSIVSEGDIITAGGITATGDVQAGIVSLKMHKHTGVQAGGGVTGPAV